MADEYDDFCLPDDVLNEMMALADAQSAPRPAAAEALPPPPAVPPPPQPYQALALAQPQSNMFDAFQPPGPLVAAPSHALAPLIHAPPPGGAAGAGGASAGGFGQQRPAYGDADGGVSMHDLQSQLQEAVRVRTEALEAKRRLEGEVSNLRLKLQQTEQGGEAERQQVQQLRTQIDGIRADANKVKEGEVDKLQIDLCFKSRELEKLQSENSKIRSKLDELTRLLQPQQQQQQQQQRESPPFPVPPTPTMPRRMSSGGGGAAMTPHAQHRRLSDPAGVPPPPGFAMGAGGFAEQPYHNAPSPAAAPSPLFRATPSGTSRKRRAGSGSPSKVTPPPNAGAPLLPHAQHAQTPSPRVPPPAPGPSTLRTPSAALPPHQQHQQNQQHQQHSQPPPPSSNGLAPHPNFAAWSTAGSAPPPATSPDQAWQPPESGWPQPRAPAPPLAQTVHHQQMRRQVATQAHAASRPPAERAFGHEPPRAPPYAFAPARHIHFDAAAGRHGGDVGAGGATSLPTPSQQQPPKVAGAKRRMQRIQTMGGDGV